MENKLWKDIVWEHKLQKDKLWKDVLWKDKLEGKQFMEINYENSYKKPKWRINGPGFDCYDPGFLIQILVYMKPVKPADYNENSKNGNYINCVCNVLNKDR